MNSLSVLLCDNMTGRCEKWFVKVNLLQYMFWLWYSFTRCILIYIFQFYGLKKVMVLRAFVIYDNFDMFLVFEQ